MVRKAGWSGLDDRENPFTKSIKNRLDIICSETKAYDDNAMRILLREVELIALSHALRRNRNSVKMAADYLSMPYINVYNLMSRRGIKKEAGVEYYCVDEADLVVIRLTRTGIHTVKEIQMVMAFARRSYAEAKFIVEHPPQIIRANVPIKMANIWRTEYHKTSPGSAIHFE